MTHTEHHHGHIHADPAKDGVRDPVCGMAVDPHTAKHRHQHKGHAYYFCSAGCRTKFAADPGEVPDKAERAAEPVPEGAIYTCPMHPEIRQVGPGSCPICGMALEPEIATADTGPNPELADMSRRFWIGLVLTLPVFALEMGAHVVGGHGFIDQTLSNWIQFAFATPVVLWAGWPFFVRGAQSVVTRNLNMFTLIAMGTGVAYLYSVVATVRAGRFPRRLPRPHRRGRGLFRGRRRHHGPGAARPGARAARARGDLRRDPRADRSRAEDRAARARRRRRGHRTRSGRGRATFCVSGPATRCRSTAS